MSINDNADPFRLLLRELVPDKRRLRVLDVGTGAGYAAIMLAQMGHDVVALDNSDEMLEKARYNARYFHVNVEFLKADIQRPGLIQRSFDLVVAKDTLWCLDDPVQAYSEWLCLLKPGGFLLIKDGNYYLDLFDEDYAKRRRYFDLRDGTDSNMHARTNLDGVSLQRIKDIACSYPLSKERRPSWDTLTLLGLGIRHVDVRSLDSSPYSVLTEEGMMKLPLTFAIIAQVPYDPVTFNGSESSVTDDRMEDIASELESLNVPGLSVIKALSDEKRLRIVYALRGGRMSVRQISRVTGDSQSMVSHSLKILRAANVVCFERCGKEMIYQLVDRFAVDSLLEISSVLKTTDSINE